MKQTLSPPGAILGAIIWIAGIGYLGWRVLYYYLRGKQRGETMFGVRNRTTKEHFIHTAQSALNSENGSITMVESSEFVGVGVRNVSPKVADVIRTAAASDADAQNEQVREPVSYAARLIAMHGDSKLPDLTGLDSVSREAQSARQAVMNTMRQEEIGKEKERIRLRLIRSIAGFIVNVLSAILVTAGEKSHESPSKQFMEEDEASAIADHTTQQETVVEKLAETHSSPVGNGSSSHQDNLRTIIHHDVESGQLYSITSSKQNRNVLPPSTRPNLSLPSGARFMGMNSTFSIGEITVNSGLVYYGEPHRGSSYPDWEPSLIDPTLSIVDYRRDRSADRNSYVSDYHFMSPGERQTYLNWLSDGRPLDTGINVTYIRLFLNGLERRLLVDLRNVEGAKEGAKGEAALLYSELKRIYGAYPDRWPVSGDVPKLVEFTNLLYDIEPFVIPMDRQIGAVALPLSLKLELGRLARNREPIPPSLALRWVFHTPLHYTRTPFERCRQEFETLFAAKYRAEYGDGLLFPKSRQKRFIVSYNSFNRSVREVQSISVEGISDVTGDEDTYAVLDRIYDECAVELDAYSRYLGRAKDSASPAVGYSLLPKECFESITNSKVKQLIDRCRGLLSDAPFVVVSKDELLCRMGLNDRTKLSKKDTAAVTEFLRKAGIGAEPDYRFLPYKIDSLKHYVMFTLDDSAENVASEAYSTAMLFLQLAVGISGSNRSLHPAEKEHLFYWIESQRLLTKTERLRLRFFTEWLAVELPDMSSLKKRIQGLSQAQIQSMSWILIEAATVDGNIEPAEIKMLQKVYVWMKKDPEFVYSDITKFHSDEVFLDPHGLIAHRRNTQSNALSHSDGLPRNSEIKLDQKKIRKKIEETKQVKSLLMNVFVDPDEEIAKVEIAPTKSTIKLIPGLDEKHSKLVYCLIQTAKISREEFEELCRSEGLFADGAMELINEAFYAIADEPLLEDDDPILVDQKAANIVKSL